MRESVIETYLKKLVSLYSGVCIKLSSMNAAGWPDQLVLLPGPRIAFVELKAPGKVQTPLQVKKMAVLADMGFFTAVLDRKEHVKVFVEYFAQSPLRQ